MYTVGCIIFTLFFSFFCAPSQNVGPHFETWNTGILGPISLSGLNEGRRDLSWQKWSYTVSHFTFIIVSFSKILDFFVFSNFSFVFGQIGLQGESLSLHSISGSSSVEWVEGSLVAERQPLTWYKVSVFTFPHLDDPKFLDF